MWGENLLFATREEAADRHLFALAVMSDTSHDYTDAKVLQNWLSGVIGHLEALPEPTQIALGLPLFKIGDEHFSLARRSNQELAQRAMSFVAATIV
jgi:hypothetical protein